MPEFSPALIAAVDIGSPMAGRLGWAALPKEQTGKDIQELVNLVVIALSEGPVALGFEAPVEIDLQRRGNRFTCNTTLKTRHKVRLMD